MQELRECGGCPHAEGERHLAGVLDLMVVADVQQVRGADPGQPHTAPAAHGRAFADDVPEDVHRGRPGRVGVLLGAGDVVAELGQPALDRCPVAELLVAVGGQLDGEVLHQQQGALAQRPRVVPVLQRGRQGPVHPPVRRRMGAARAGCLVQRHRLQQLEGHRGRLPPGTRLRHRTPPL
ncbi:hypothetical protein ACIBEA_30480 [Streptomyces sp. NPDC051555]|uniref:hypothetical protein n=1 Tax=Streptomyces sp. NPDC051555 TaxID=3365657 RepID=UPI0037B976ED